MIHVRAPATTANLGAGFDCAGAALDLWNELELAEDGGVAEPDHLAVRAFARLASPDGYGFTFTERIPRARGLGSSAATIALGLVAGAAAAGSHRKPRRAARTRARPRGPSRQSRGGPGGRCLPDLGRSRCADRRRCTGSADRDCPARRDCRDTRRARGAAGDDPARRRRVHRRASSAPRCGSRVRRPLSFSRQRSTIACTSPIAHSMRPRWPRFANGLPDGALGATLSGSGPTVIVWARPESADACAEELTERFPDADVLHLSISPTGAAQL